MVVSYLVPLKPEPEEELCFPSKTYVSKKIITSINAAMIKRYLNSISMTALPSDGYILQRHFLNCNTFLSLFDIFLSCFNSKHSKSPILHLRKTGLRLFYIYHSEALKLYTGLMTSITSTASSITSMMSSKDLYAIGDSSMVASQTDVV